NRMLEQLCARLQGRALAAQELRLELTLDNGRLPSDEVAPPFRLLLAKGGTENSEHLGIFRRTVHLPLPLLNAKIFLKLLQLDLQANPPGAPITKVHLHIEPAKPRPGQNGFFVPSSPEPEKLELTLARINGIVGEGRAGSPLLLDTHRREAFEMRHFSPSENKLSGDRRLAHPTGNGHKVFARLAECEHPGLDHLTDSLVSGLRIFRPPIHVRVNYSKGRLSHVRSLKGRQISGEVLWSAGPWRSSGDWWEHDEWMRDEWDIALQEKDGIILYRLVHDLISGRWLLEGKYD
ncbi:MAG TPA: hypothetical protein VJO35_10635, partial [Terriglobales bacterium]|nr:hypothetical protein [Terriglobales bacterium]